MVEFAEITFEAQLRVELTSVPDNPVGKFMVTRKVAAVPSGFDAETAERTKFGFGSSSLIVPVPAVFGPKVPLVTFVRLTVKVSVFSRMVSRTMFTSNVLTVSAGANVARAALTIAVKSPGATAEPLTVLPLTIEVSSVAPVLVIVNRATVVPTPLPSVTVSLGEPTVAVRLNTGAASSFVMVPKPVPRVADPKLKFVRLALNVSSSSKVTSPLTITATCLDVWPWVNVTVSPTTAV